jgi:hypothetical protein
VNGCGPRRASSSTKAIAAKVLRDTRRGLSSKRVSDRVGSSVNVPRAAADKPRKYSPLVGVGDDEDGEESEGVDKMAAVAGARSDWVRRKIERRAKVASQGGCKSSWAKKRWRVFVTLGSQQRVSVGSRL